MKTLLHRGVPHEDEEQATVIEWARWNSTLARMRQTHGCLGLLFGIMNAGKRSYATAHWAQQQGMKKGVPDLLLPVARGGYHGLFIEMKRQRGGRLSGEQAWWGNALREQGYLVIVAAGADRAIEWLEKYLSWGSGDAQGRELSGGCHGDAA